MVICFFFSLTAETSNQCSSVQMTPAQSPGPAPMSPATPSSQANNANSVGAAITSATGALRSGGAPSLAASMCDPVQLSSHVKELRSEVMVLRNRLQIAERDHTEKMSHLEKEEREQREQNVRLRRKLQMEIERRERLCRHLRLVLSFVCLYWGLVTLTKCYCYSFGYHCIDL